MSSSDLTATHARCHLRSTGPPCGGPVRKNRMTAGVGVVADRLSKGAKF
jgi:hypothetical protein